ncbi:MAG TPA: hypothetical protein VJS44_08355 [Pyrinomonadaceae bacterium]|nr:hypothetical protein [Pyrinomonadaceae bacterium]
MDVSKFIKAQFKAGLEFITAAVDVCVEMGNRDLAIFFHRHLSEKCRLIERKFDIKGGAGSV